MILVCGYYDRSNLGDDAFRQVMPLFFSEIEFWSIDDLAKLHGNPEALTQYRAIVVGGGDLINEYFYRRLVPLFKAYRKVNAQGKIMAFGIGLPYPKLVDEGYLDWYDHVFVRAKRDVRLVQRRLGSTYGHYLPDLAFAMRVPSAPSLSQLSLRHTKRIGIFLIQAIAEHKSLVDNLVQLFWKLSKRYELVFYRFDTSNTSSGDDQFVNRLIQDRLAELWQTRSKSAKKRNVVLVNNTIYTPERMMVEMQRCSAAICMRFHAHVFATLTGLPFLSICETRKVSELVADLGLEGYSCAPTAGWRHMLEVFQQVIGAETLPLLLQSKAAEYALLLESAQPRQLLEWSTRPERQTVGENDVINTLEIECQRLAKDFVGMLQRHGAEHAAELLCWTLTRNPHSAYLHGAKERMLLQPSRHQLYDMIKWIKLDLLEKRAEAQRRCLDLHYIEQGTAGVHRAGWQYCLDYMEQLQNSHGIICDTYVDRSFHWARDLMVQQGLLPYTSPWIGFVHHTPSDFSRYNTQHLVNCIAFQQSLPTCLGLICLSHSLAEWLRERLPASVTIISLQHPTEFVHTGAQWSLHRFQAAPRKLIQVGGWYRNPWTIHTLEPDQLTEFVGRAALCGRAMENYFRPAQFSLRRHGNGRVRGHTLVPGHAHGQPCTSVGAGGDGTMCRDPHSHNKWLHYLCEWLARQPDLPRFRFEFGTGRRPKRHRELWHRLNRMIASVERIDCLSNSDYDRLLGENVVFLDLVDCSACNTLIECIVRCTPIVINPLPAVVEYLGADYPLYWPVELTLSKIKAANRYLRKLDKSALRVSHFIDALKNSPLLAKACE